MYAFFKGTRLIGKIFHQKLVSVLLTFSPYQIIKGERRVLTLRDKNAFGSVQENKLTTVVSLLDHLAHAVDMVRALGCTAECGVILSLVLAFKNTLIQSLHICNYHCVITMIIVDYW